MHLGNGAITPECVALTYGAAAAGLAVSGVAIRMAGVAQFTCSSRSGDQQVGRTRGQLDEDVSF